MEPALLGALHHIGIVVASIEQSLPGYLAALDSHATTGVIHDPLQRANVLFLRTNPTERVQLELVEPAGEHSPVQGFLLKGGGMHHLCYEVADMGAALQSLRKRGAMIVSEPQPAVAFGGREVAWAMTREWMLIELLSA